MRHITLTAASRHGHDTIRKPGTRHGKML